MNSHSTANINIDIILLKLNALKLTSVYCKQTLSLMKISQNNVSSDEIIKIIDFLGFKQISKKKE